MTAAKVPQPRPRVALELNKWTAIIDSLETLATVCEQGGS
jgi:hypothetical protein